MKFLLVTPPLTQLNTPYPATAVLKGYLQSQGYDAVWIVKKNKVFVKEGGIR